MGKREGEEKQPKSRHKPRNPHLPVLFDILEMLQAVCRASLNPTQPCSPGTRVSVSAKAVVGCCGAAPAMARALWPRRATERLNITDRGDTRGHTCDCLVSGQLCAHLGHKDGQHVGNATRLLGLRRDLRCLCSWHIALQPAWTPGAALPEALSELRHPLVLRLLLSHEDSTNSLSCYQS